MLEEIVICEECGKQGTKDENGICGYWIGLSPENGYACPDIICYDGCEE